MADFGETIYPIARKEHRCEWCGQGIDVGENHAKFVGRWEGEWQNWRMHRECYTCASDNRDIQDGFMPYEGERPAHADQEATYPCKPDIFAATHDPV